MSAESPGEGWWQASDGNWYPPELLPQPGTATQPSVRHLSESQHADLADDGGLSRREAKRREKAERRKAATEAALSAAQDSIVESARTEAVAALEAGHSVFQWQCQLSTTKLSLMGMSPNLAGRGGNSSTRSFSDATNASLAAVERAGWRLTAMSTVFVPTAEVSRDKTWSSGQETAIAGNVLGVYVFHRSGG
ncbi:MAG: hypothetical protein ACKO5A_06575 [Actinomycetota bacterium]